MNFEELFHLLQKGDERDRIEAKAAANGVGKSYLETVSALSNEPNLGGGYILFGLAKNDSPLESSYEVIGVQNPDQLQQQIASHCRQLFNVPIRPLIKTVSYRGKTVLVIYIAEANLHDKPIYLKKEGL